MILNLKNTSTGKGKDTDMKPKKITPEVLAKAYDQIVEHNEKIYDAQITEVKKAIKVKEEAIQASLEIEKTKIKNETAEKLEKLKNSHEQKMKDMEAQRQKDDEARKEKWAKLRARNNPTP